MNILCEYPMAKGLFGAYLDNAFVRNFRGPIPLTFTQNQLLLCQQDEIELTKLGTVFAASSTKARSKENYAVFWL